MAVNKRKIAKRVLLTAVVVVALLVGIGVIMLNSSILISHRGTNIEQSYEQMFQRYPHVESWVDSLKQVNALKDTTIINKSGRKLHGFYVAAPNPTKKTAVIVHGYTDNAIRMFMIGHLYNKELEYNILLPDLQCHGLSEGKEIQMGWKDRLDVIEWIDVALNKFGRDNNITLHGISMGAATIMMVSGTEDIEQIKCYVEDCGYTSVWDEFTGELKNMFNLPQFPILHVSSMLCDFLYGWNFKEASAVESVKNCNKPMFFIHGDADTFVPTWMVYDLYEAKAEPKELWIVKGAKHAVAYLENREEYTERVSEFVERYMN